VFLFWYLPEPEPSRSSASAASRGSTDSSSSGGSDETPPPELAPPPAPEIPDEQIQASIRSQLDEVDKLPDDQKLSELEKNLQRLDSVASPESVDEVSRRIASTLGLDAETYQSKEPADDEPFDPSTAQLDDVTRVRSGDGSWRYESVLVDAQGHRMTVPMSAAEGETAYNTFEQLKQFPIAEGIYRSVVMPMIQRMIEAGDAGAETARDNAEAAREAQAKASEAGAPRP
jgi:hypothetical protein